VKKTRKELEDEIQIQKDIAFTAGILQGDITLKILFESIAEVVIVVNKLGRIIMVNNRFEDLFGYAKKDIMGEPLDILLLPHFREKHEHLLISFFSNPSVRAMGGGFDLVGLSKSKKEIPIEISLSYLETSAGSLGLAFISNITHRKNTEKEILAKNAALDAYAHTIAHDLKSSLNSIVGYSELLIADKSIDAKNQEMILNQIREGGYKMNEIIDAILFMAKVDKSDVELSRIDIQTLIDSVLKRLNNDIQKKKAEIKVINNHELHLRGLGYAPWVEEILYNLVSNALKHGGEKPLIQIGCKEDGNYVCYYVQNFGNLLTKEQIDTLFKSIGEVKSDSVSGFGLSIVHRILQKLDGKLEIESSEEFGNIFSFFLPKKERITDE